MKHSETEKTERSPEVKLPVRSGLNLVYVNTLVLLILMTGISVTGIVFRASIYPGEELSVVFVPNDFVNLFLGVPILIASYILCIRQKLIGLLLYPGALFYITYIYVSYLLGLPFNVLFIPYMLLVILSIYTIIGLVLKIDSDQVHAILEGHVPIRATGYILFVIACLIIIYQVFQIIHSHVGQEEVDQLAMAQWIVDLVFAAPPLLIISYQMIRRKNLGYLLGISLLLLLGALFHGLTPLLIVTAKLTGNAGNVTDIMIVSGSSMICMIPFIVFARGITKASKSLQWKK